MPTYRSLSTQHARGLIGHRHLLELKSSNLAWKACDQACHLPRAQGVLGRPRCTALGIAIVLLQTPLWIRGAADVQRGMSRNGAQQVARVKGWNW